MPAAMTATLAELDALIRVHVETTGYVVADGTPYEPDKPPAVDEPEDD